jgi:hypothetical protein
MEFFGTDGHNGGSYGVLVCIMSLTSSNTAAGRRIGPTALTAAWEWLARPTHYRAVRKFRVAAQRGDAERLTSLLEPGIAVVVDAGQGDAHPIRVVSGTHDAVALLSHGMAEQPGRVVAERSVNGQAGLMVSDGTETSAAITVDFTGRRISVVWIRLHPTTLRHWNMV